MTIFSMLGGGPIQMLFGLLLMQGLSLTMWRTFLNQTIPQFNPFRYSFQVHNQGNNGPGSVGNTPTQRESESGTRLTQTQIDQLQKLFQSMLPLQQQQQPFVQQQQPQIVPQVQLQLPFSLAPNYQQQQPVQQQVQPQIIVPQSHYIAPLQAPFNHPNHQPAPAPLPAPAQPPPAQIIVLPQILTASHPSMQQLPSPRQGSASTHFSVQVEPPDTDKNTESDDEIERENDDDNDVDDGNDRMLKRMLIRPPPTRAPSPAFAPAIRPSVLIVQSNAKEEANQKTNNAINAIDKKERVLSRMHAGFGAIKFSFATPKIPAGHPRVTVIPAVTAKLASVGVGDAHDDGMVTTIASDSGGGDDIDEITTVSPDFARDEHLQRNESEKFSNHNYNDSQNNSNINSNINNNSSLSFSTSSFISGGKVNETNFEVNETLARDFIEFIANLSANNGGIETFQAAEATKTSTIKNSTSSNNATYFSQGDIMILNDGGGDGDGVAINQDNNNYVDKSDKQFEGNMVVVEENENANANTMNQIKRNDNIYFEQPKSLFARKDSSSSSTNNTTFKRVCYYLLHAQQDHGEMSISEIDPSICTHLIIGFASVDAKNHSIIPKREDDVEKYNELAKLKSKPNGRHLKLLLSIGDVTNGTFSQMVLTRARRKSFISSALNITDKYGFDGIDIDWEFPSKTRSSWKSDENSKDKDNFISLLKELREASADKRRSLTNKSDYIISAAVGTPLAIAAASYDIPKINEIVNFVNLISYDYHYYRPDRPYTGHHAPLYPRPIEKGYFITLNAAWAATYWANKGMSPSKIMLGVATFARTYNLAVPINQGLDVPVTGPGLGGGKMNYTQVCSFLSSPGTIKEFDIHGQVPFAYKDYDWLAYEDEHSVASKARWVAEAGFGGIMTYALNWDDWKGECKTNRVRFPLQNAISSTLEKASLERRQKDKDKEAGQSKAK